MLTFYTRCSCTRHLSGNIVLLLLLASWFAAFGLAAQNSANQSSENQQPLTAAATSTLEPDSNEPAAAGGNPAQTNAAETGAVAVDAADTQDNSSDSLTNADDAEPETAVSTTLTLVAQPIFPQYLAASVYAPLADYLAQGLRTEIKLVTPKNFQAHWAAIKAGVQHDLAIEEAPLTDYRIRYRHYLPLVRDRAKQSYTLAVLDNQLTDKSDLVGLSVASLAAPSSAYLFMIRWYDNPLSQPQIISTATSYAEAVQQLWAGEFAGVVLPSELATDYPQFNFIATSESMPGLAISASPSLDAELRERVTELLLQLNDEKNFAILDELNIEALDAADPAQYQGYAEWIRAVSYSGFD
ncbi:MAG: PhnD/SsuA/transferrin family substrate-binding protein [Gammaproteobacteria bacterium]|jgi:predicted lactoylglutathione lyase|nr:PhnD/SsuA/transferrin family substrate-binding protein [Gammaproteobacteria bacterium]